MPRTQGKINTVGAAIKPWQGSALNDIVYNKSHKKYKSTMGHVVIEIIIEIMRQKTMLVVTECALKLVWLPEIVAFAAFSSTS